MDRNTHSKSKVKVVLLENIHSKALEIFEADGYTNVVLLKSSFEGPELYEEIRGAQLLGIRSRTSITEKVLAHCPKLLAIGCYCIGTNQVALRDAMLRGIPVFNDPHSNTRSVAELVIGFSIALMRGLFPKHAAAHEGRWNKAADGAHELRGKTLGIIGYGRIGSQVSVLAEALGMNVLYYDIEPKLSLGNAKPVILPELLALSDIVTLHVPETPLTNHLIDSRSLQWMKKDSFLINTSRGKVVDNQALAAALERKKLRGAAMDVFENEPADSAKPFESPLRSFANVILTPHIGGATEEAQENIGVMVSQKLIDFMNRGSTVGAANFPSLSLPLHEHTRRVLHIHENKPGMLSQINKVLADRNINILGQSLGTTAEVGYVVFDIEKGYHNHMIDALKAIEGTIRVRILY